MLCNEGDVIQTFLNLVCGEATFRLVPVTITQLNEALQRAAKIHSKRVAPRVKFTTCAGISIDKAHIYNPLDVIVI